MFRILIADFVIEIQNKFKYIERFCADYIYDGDRLTDFSVCVSETEMQNERDVSEFQFPDGYIESVCVYRKIALKLPQRDALLVHGATVAYRDKGIIFLAKSGVGKTTHTMLWKSVYGDDLTVINGDKPIIRFVDGVPFAYGTPWAGKEGMQKNSKVKVTDICFIERDVENSTVKIQPSERLDSVMQQILMPNEPFAALKTLELVDKLTTGCNNWLIKCNPTESAAVTAHDAICSE